MILQIEIEESILRKFLSYGNHDLNTISQDQLSNIKKSMETGILSLLIDQPHYTYEDYIEKILDSK